MKISLLVAWMAVALALTGCKNTNQPPEHGMIEMAFFKCEQCQSVEGGIYGKGPTKKLHGPKAPECVHNWERITKDDFRGLGAKWSDIDWSKEIPWWTDFQSMGPARAGMRETK